MAIDINRTTSGIELPQELSNEVISKVQEGSAVMQLASQVALPGRGMSIPVITSDPTPAWVGETDEKPVSNPAFKTKNMTAYKLAVIVPFSNEFRRDASTLYSEIVNRIPAKLAEVFDQTVFGATAKPGENFDQLSTADGFNIATDTYKQLVAAKVGIAASGYQANGSVLAPAAEGILLNAVDGNGRPLFIDSASEQGDAGKLLGISALYRKAAGNGATVGFVGDWSQARYGIVEGVSIDLTDQATLTSGSDAINLWQRNMFAVRAEVEVGFITTDTAAFAKLTNA